MMCRVLQVSRSGFYKWQTRGRSQRSQDDAKLKRCILSSHGESRGTYGPIRLQKDLARQGIFVGRDRIRRLRNELGLRCVQKRKYKATTNSKHQYPVAKNLLGQDFTVREPGKVWGVDLTYIATGEGWLYLAGVKDYGSQELIGYAMGSRMTQELTREALQRALRKRKPKFGCIHHSDRGSQYCAHEYQKLVKNSGLTASMSRKGNCYDNAPIESFWGALKQELIHARRFSTRKEAMVAIKEYIEIFYNRIRLHSSIGYLPPSIYAENYYKQRRISA